MKRTGSAVWNGDFNNGKGTISTQSKVLDNTQYSFKTRFEDGIGTNPEELLAASHAGCFTMAVSVMCTKKGLIPTELRTEATLDLDLQNLTINNIHLSIVGQVPGISEADFAAIVKDAEQSCIISKALKVPITSDSRLI